VKLLILGIVLGLAGGVALAARAALVKRRRFDDRSDVTKLVLSAGDRRRDTKAKARLMGDH
jgi:ABC-type arginine transport system ATPase subunit